MTAGRDLTAADVEYALSQTRLSGYIAARLNRIARAGDDEPPARRRLGGLDQPDPDGSEDAWDDTPDALIEAAHGLICNVDGSGQGWRQSDEWVEAADRWMARYDRVLRAGGGVSAGQDEPCSGEFNGVRFWDGDGWNVEERGGRVHLSSTAADARIELTPPMLAAIAAAAAPAVDTAGQDEQRADLAALRDLAERQAVAYRRMRELGGGVGQLGHEHPDMFEDMLTWDDHTDNRHADTVLGLLAELDRLRAAPAVGAAPTCTCWHPDAGVPEPSEPDPSCPVHGAVDTAEHDLESER